MRTKVTIDPGTAIRISKLYAMGYHTGQIASLVNVAECTVVDVLQRDSHQRRVERSMRYGKTTAVG